MTQFNATEALPPPLANLCVLIAEDRPDEQRQLSRILENAGARVMTAVKGSEALRLAQLMRPDIVLMDVQQPQSAGFSICRALQQHPDTGHIPVLFVSALRDEQPLLEGFASGGRDFITKPFTSAELVARVALHADLGRRLNAAQREAGTPRWLTVVLQRLQASLAQPPNLDLLAKEAGTTVHRLKEAFRHQLNTTPAAFVRETRLIEAAWQMNETVKSVAEVGAALGYSSAANFATAFRERFGLSPLQYRQSRTTAAQSALKSPAALVLHAYTAT